MWKLKQKELSSLLLALILALDLAWNLQAEVPPPSETPAKIIVSGRTSTAVDIKIVKLGQEVPPTTAGKFMANTPNFEWYISQHYALKSAMDEKFSREVLEMSELALPHWIELTDLEPPDQDTMRMPIVYARNRQEVDSAVRTDISSFWAGEGGGVTLWKNLTAYNYPSGTLMYHKRDLVIHENLHMLQGIVKKNMGTEGMTYSGAQHVYDSRKKQLTVFCFDKAPINNFSDAGITALRQEHVRMQTAVEKFWESGGGHGVMYTQFFLTDPDRLMKWRLWRDQFYAGKVKELGNTPVMESIFGSLDQLNTEWEKWVAQRRVTFHHVDWGWEQDGNDIWAYGFPWDDKHWSQMDIMYAPNEKAEYDPLRLDYPAEPMPAIVGPVERGIAEPSVGFVISQVGNCWGGFGLGVEGRSMCMVVVQNNQTLVIDGHDFGIERKEITLTAEVKEAAKTDSDRFGITIRSKQNELAVTVRAGKPEAMQEMQATVPITAEQRERLLTKHMSMVGRGGYPRFTPFIDDARQPALDLTQPAPANRWRFAGDKQLYELYKIAFELGDATPESLLRLKQRMVEAMDKDFATQQAAMEMYEQKISDVMTDVKVAREQK